MLFDERSNGPGFDVGAVRFVLPTQRWTFGREHHHAVPAREALFGRRDVFRQARAFPTSARIRPESDARALAPREHRDQSFGIRWDLVIRHAAVDRRFRCRHPAVGVRDRPDDAVAAVDLGNFRRPVTRTPRFGDVREVSRVRCGFRRPFRERRRDAGRVPGGVGIQVHTLTFGDHVRRVHERVRAFAWRRYRHV